MKQRLLFVIDSLMVGGAEKSLLTFLSALDYSRFDVDVQLFGYGGKLQQYLPREVRLLPPLPLPQFLAQPRWRQVLTLRLPWLWAGWRFSKAISKPGLGHADRARLYWTHFSRFFTPTADYDVAIAYAQNLPTLYVAEKAKARKKMAWVNAIYRPTAINRSFLQPFYSHIDHIVAVSPSAKETFQNVYPQFASRVTVIMDMLDEQHICRMSNEEPAVRLTSDCPAIVTMARLNKATKGYDISLEACRLLRDRGARFRWYALGEGPYRTEMKEYIKQHHLEDTFILSGAVANPYPVLRQCTLYVQTSRHEGFGLSIAEARILNKPVVTTEFDAVYAQMVPGENGLVVPQDPVAVADAIERLLNDAALYRHIVEYQQQEKKGNTEEIEKFYQLIKL